MSAMARGALMCVVTSASLLAYAGAAAAQTREAAIESARRGDYETAISALQTLAQAAPAETGVRFDLAVVLQWAGRSREATDVFESMPGNEAPEYVLSAVARAYRDQQRWADAAGVAAEGRARFPGSAEWPLATKLVEGGIALQDGDRFGALRAYFAARQLAPNDTGLQSEISGILVGLGAPFTAGLHAAGRDPGIEAREAAALVNQATRIPALTPAQRFDRTDAALARLDSLLATARTASSQDDALVRRLRSDRVVALRDRERWLEVVNEVTALRNEGMPIPPYVRQAEADTLLALRRPAEARTAYQEVLGVDARSITARVGLFYALLEDEHVSAALALADVMAAEGGPKTWRGVSPIPAANWDWLDAQVLAANARYYVGEHREAWRRLQPLVAGAPALSFLRLTKAEIANARGWPRLADEETHIAAVLTFPDRPTEIALAEVALARKRYEEARQRTSSLVSLFPGDQAVERVRRSLHARNVPELRLDSQFRTERGDSVDSPGSGYDVRSALLAPPIAERWRFKAAYEFSQARPVEGVVQRSRYGAGVETDWPDASLDATAWINRGTLDRPGARVAGTWEIGDHLQVSGEGERYSADTPLRATYYGISSDGGAARVSYAWDAATITSAALRRSWFSDGNDRVEVSGFLAARVVERPGLAVELRPELWWGSNTRLDAPYFNPRRSASADVTAATRHLLWRWYERSLNQELRLTAGTFAQEANPLRWTGSVSYEHILQLTTDSALYYGLGYSHRVYDARPVEDVRVWINLGHRFQ
jgi:biofilm PGA synthesis protein PgaA